MGCLLGEVRDRAEGSVKGYKLQLFRGATKSCALGKGLGDSERCVLAAAQGKVGGNTESCVLELVTCTGTG